MNLQRVGGAGLAKDPEATREGAVQRENDSHGRFEI